MNIRKTLDNDVSRIMEIYEFARDFMKKTSNPNQWGNNNWPPRNLILNDIKKGNSYVCLNDDEKVIGTFYYDFGKNVEPAYNIITDGEWLSDEPYGVIHRIASDGSEKGIGTFCINWVFDNCKHIRIDTHKDNKVMQNLLNKLGFKYCGIINLPIDNGERIAFEKI